MKEKVNGFLHLISALYTAVFTVLGLFIAPVRLVSGGPIRLFVSIGIGAIILDAIAAFLQWHRPSSGHILSIALHFLFAEAVVTITAFEYLQSGVHLGLVGDQRTVCTDLQQ